MAESKLRNLSTDFAVDVIKICENTKVMIETNIPHENAKSDR